MTILVLCAICDGKVPLETIAADMEAAYPHCGQIQLGQKVILCLACHHVLHTSCVEEAGTTIAWYDLWYASIEMRWSIEEEDLLFQDIALCRKCHEELVERIISNYKLVEKFKELAEFLGEIGRYDEARALLAEIEG